VLHLDGRPVRTPARAIVKVGKRSIADVLAEEWRAQEKVIDPKKMPLTRLLNSAIDGVSLLCYRADDPERLVARQNDLWDPVINWAQETYSCRFLLAGGVMHVEQPEETKQAMERAINDYKDPITLAALHSMTTLLGSTLLALAVSAGYRTMQEAWDAAHLDEDWNIELWGTDEDAIARRAYRLEEMKAAAIVLTAT